MRAPLTPPLPQPKRVSCLLLPLPLHSLIIAPRVSPDITPRGPGEAEAISRAVHGGDVWAAFGKFGHVPGMGPEDRHAPPAKSNSGKGQEWGGSQAKEPGLKSLPTGLPVPPRPAPAQRGWQRGGSSPASTGQGDPTAHPAGQSSQTAASLLPHQQGTKDTAPAQPIGNALSRASVLAGTRLVPPRDTGAMSVSTASLNFPLVLLSLNICSKHQPHHASSKDPVLVPVPPLTASIGVSSPPSTCHCTDIVRSHLLYLPTAQRCYRLDESGKL